MTITSADIKLMQPERLSDDADGGGQMTGLPVVDGDINNLFEDISRVNRTYGSVSMRKAFLKVDTATADLYLDSHAILSAQPADPNVTGLLFSTEDFYDERVQARVAVESFVIQGPVTGLQLRGTQLKGQRALICYAPSVNTVPSPEVGETYMLQINDDLETRQFIKVLGVEQSSEIFTYEVEGGNIRTFRAEQYVLSISTDLKQDYPAESPSPLADNAARLYSTQPASSGKYYGTTTLAEQALAGDTAITVTDTFAPIVPTASTETPVVDQRPGGFSSLVVESADADITLSVTVAGGATSLLPCAIVPGSMSLVLSGVTYTDKGGIFVNGSGDPAQLDGAEIDYLSGIISWGTATASGTGNLTFRSGALYQRLPNTGTISIVDGNRNFNYVMTLDPAPAPKTFHASYQYLGKWYYIYDDGSGVLIGDGSGQINFDTGSVVLTLQAQPDADSLIFYRWAEGGIFAKAADIAFTGPSPVRLTTSQAPVKPGTFTLSWDEGGVGKTATEAGDGVLTGDATGTIDYARGVISLTSGNAPDDDYTLDYTFKDAVPTVTTIALSDNLNQSDVTFTLPTGIAPGGLRFDLVKSYKRQVLDENDVVLSEWYEEVTASFYDDGNGNMKERHHQDVFVGTINYSTGDVVLWGTEIFQSRRVKANAKAVSAVVGYAQEYYTKQQGENLPEILLAQSIDINHNQATDVDTTQQDTRAYNAQPWNFTLARQYDIVPGSVILDIDGAIWFDDGDGRLLHSYDTTTGTGVVAGTIDYGSADCTIPYYAGRAHTATITPVATLIGKSWGVFRGGRFLTSASPLRPSGFNIRGDNINTGTQYNGEADHEGVITGDGITGSVDLQDGFVQVEFPAPVSDSTVFYNAVSFKQIPLDEDILGLDPVRLPGDGRVPILRDADILVITHTQKDLIPSPGDGVVVNAGRDKLYDGWIEDDEATRLSPAQYTLDKAAGTATLATPFTAEDAQSNPLVGDLHFVHRIDDMALCTEARISGRLQLAQPLYHDFPVADTWVASAVYLGSLRAKTQDWVSYTTDPGDYDGEGTPTNAQYNLIAYPIAIDNRGAVPDRWKIKFNSTTTFELFSEQRGLVASGDTGTDFSPTNPQTGTPYFTIVASGWGSGWSTGNTVRFDTEAAAAPLWLIRTVLPGLATVDDDQLKIELRGDHN
ncbi:hypothetical protein HCU74_08425 [Spongiibacter sp. KMU-166]|uniref:DUF4815 domain-containing protein n=1 Tax=Spongiibacter thalassae TaxID=2721624 RepID=A0ABX1GES3_9GAMM|nr:hypothetical protein [Spongiibacter thalassae]NKI17441.1 hypothetical protein [Spongiibacter thalassae]